MTLRRHPVTHYRWLAGMGIAFLLFSQGIACGSTGSSDTDKIMHRTNSFVDHVEKHDAKAVLTDFPPEQRAKCDERGIQKGLSSPNTDEHVTVTGIVVGTVTGDRATADVTVKQQRPGRDDRTTTSTVSFLKRSGDWYIDASDKKANIKSCSF